jgi:hypothetical protein
MAVCDARLVDIEVAGKDTHSAVVAGRRVQSNFYI